MGFAPAPLLWRRLQRHDRESFAHLLKWHMCDGEMIHLAEIDRASRTPLQSFAEKLRYAPAIERGHFRTDFAVVQHA